MRLQRKTVLLCIHLRHIKSKSTSIPTWCIVLVHVNNILHIPLQGLYSLEGE